jgi:hypothetical protein
VLHYFLVNAPLNPYEYTSLPSHHVLYPAADSPLTTTSGVFEQEDHLNASYRSFYSLQEFTDQQQLEELPQKVDELRSTDPEAVLVVNTSNCSVDHSILSMPSDDYAREKGEIDSGFDSIKVSTKKAVAAHDQSIESSSQLFSILQSFKQRLSTEKISLEATVNQAVAMSQESDRKCQMILTEISQLNNELKSLRENLSTVYSTQSESQVSG